MAYVIELGSCWSGAEFGCDMSPTFKMFCAAAVSKFSMRICASEWPMSSMTYKEARITPGMGGNEGRCLHGEVLDDLVMSMAGV